MIEIEDIDTPIDYLEVFQEWFPRVIAILLVLLGGLKLYHSGLLEARDLEGLLNPDHMMGAIFVFFGLLFLAFSETVGVEYE